MRTGAMNEVRNQAMNGDPAQYGVLHEYRLALEAEPTRGIVRNAVRSALQEQRDAYENEDQDEDD